MKNETSPPPKKKKSHLAVDILIKERKCRKLLRTLKVTCVKSNKLQKTLLLEKMSQKSSLYFSSFNDAD